MECVCCFSLSTEKKLYECQFPNCPHLNKLLCMSCGQTIHRNIRDHTFCINKQQKSKPEMKHQSTNKSLDSPRIASSLLPTKDIKKHIATCGSAAASILASQNPIGAAVGVGFEVTKESYNYYNNDILDEKGNKDREEYVRLLGKSLCIPISSFLCGAAVKVLFVGTGCGWVIAMGYGVLGSILSQKAFEKYLPETKQKRKELKLTALRTFQFFEEDIENEDIFNKKNIAKRYRKLAKKYHPDTKYGTTQKFRELEVYHRIVLSVLDDDSVFPMVQFDENGDAYLDRTTKPKPIEYSGSQQNKTMNSNDCDSDYDTDYDGDCILM